MCKLSGRGAGTTLLTSHYPLRDTGISLTLTKFFLFQVKLTPLVTHQTVSSTVLSILPLDLLSPSTFGISVMLGWAGLAADGNDGIG